MSPEAQQEAYIVPVKCLHMCLVLCVFGHLGSSLVHSLALFDAAGPQGSPGHWWETLRPFPPRLVGSKKLVKNGRVFWNSPNGTVAPTRFFVLHDLGS